jgi:hypothetical protein
VRLTRLVTYEMPVISMQGVVHSPDLATGYLPVAAALARGLRCVDAAFVVSPSNRCGVDTCSTTSIEDILGITGLVYLSLRVAMCHPWVTEHCRSGGEAGHAQC